MSSDALTTPAFAERRTEAGRPLRLASELADVHRRLPLLYGLVRRDLTVRYKRSILGFLWTMLHPLLLLLIFLAVFSTFFRDRAPRYEIYFLSAYVAWNFFAQTTVNAMASVAWNGPLLKRVRVPPALFTLSSVISGLVNLGLSLLVLFAIMFATHAPIHAAMLFLPVSLLIVAIFTFGVAMGLTAVSYFFGDVREMIEAGLPALMYLTPIIYPLSIVPARFLGIIRINPLYYMVELVRAPIYDGVLPSTRTLSIASLAAIAAVIVGWQIFRRLAPRFHAHV